MKIVVLAYTFFLLALPYHVIYSQYNSGELPSWVFKKENFNRINMAVGISEPGSDTCQAILESKFNALICNSLLHDAKFTYLTNVGVANQSDEIKHSAAIEYILYTGIIKGRIPSLSALKILQKQFTTYKEALLLVEIDNTDYSDSSSYEYTIIRRAGFQKESKNFPLFIDEMEMLVKQKDSIVYSFCIVKDGLNIVECQKKKVRLFFEEDSPNRKSYFYPDYINPGSEIRNWPAMPQSLHNGLWKGLFFNLVDQICIYNSTDINLQFKLSTVNQGNIIKDNQILTFQQMVYSLKNIQAKSLNNLLNRIEISGNSIQLAIRSKGIQDSNNYISKKPGKSEKKQLKNLKKENWIFLGEDVVDNAWLNAWQLSADDKYLSTEIVIQANSLQSGIIEGLQLAKLQMSSLLATKIAALNNSDMNKNQTSIQSAKLINIEKTGSIGPYFIFYQNPGFNLFNIKMIILYDTNQ